MNEKNVEYLKDQLKYSGFGEALYPALQDKIRNGEQQFTLTSQNSFGRDEVSATLHFKKGTESDIYFFNRYDLSLKNEQLMAPLKQSFYIHPKEDNVTLKEGYNLLSGRAIHKEMTPKEGEKYRAWIQLDFKQTEANGSFRTKQFHENYGFDLNKELSKLPIRELNNEEQKAGLIKSLERGNRQAVIIDGSDKKILIEAAPQYKSLNLYDLSGQRIRIDKVEAQAIHAGQGTTPVKQDTGQTTKNEVKQLVKEKKSKPSIS
jgi:hypothetical protein